MDAPWVVEVGAVLCTGRHVLLAHQGAVEVGCHPESPSHAAGLPMGRCQSLWYCPADAPLENVFP